MKIIWTTFFLITNLCLGMAQKYEIKSSLELLKILREQNGQILSENEEDLSCTYTINNNKIVWLPTSGGKGIVFED